MMMALDRVQSVTQRVGIYCTSAAKLLAVQYIYLYPHQMHKAAPSTQQAITHDSIHTTPPSHHPHSCACIFAPG